MLRNVAKSIGELSDTLVILSADRLIIRYWYRGVSPASLESYIRKRSAFCQNTKIKARGALVDRPNFRY